MITSTLGSAYTINAARSQEAQDHLDHLVVMSISDGFSFSEYESFRSFLRTNPWCRYVAIFFEHEGERPLRQNIKDVLADIAYNYGKDSVRIYWIECNRNFAQPRPFVGPKVCTYSIAELHAAKAYLFLDLDMWHLSTCRLLIEKAKSGHSSAVLECGETSLYSAMYEEGGCYNGNPSDREKYAFFGEFGYANAPVYNSGVLSLSRLDANQLLVYLRMMVIQDLTKWMFTKNGDKFIGNREQAIVGHLLVKIGIETIHSGWNIQLVRDTRLILSNGKLVYPDAPICILHFNGFANPNGPAREWHNRLLHCQKILKQAGLPIEIGGFY